MIKKVAPKLYDKVRSVDDIKELIRNYAYEALKYEKKEINGIKFIKNYEDVKNTIIIVVKEYNDKTRNDIYNSFNNNLIIHCKFLNKDRKFITWEVINNNREYIKYYLNNEEKDIVIFNTS
jgi:hypothetical protein